jgi:hypothetical protein
MPTVASVVAKFTKQTLLYWQKIGSDGFGKPVFADPVEVKARWEDKLTERVMSDGRIISYNAYILTNTPLVDGSLVFLGGGKTPTLDWKALPTYPRLPTVGQGAREIVRLDQTPGPPGLSGVLYECWA